MSIFQLSLFYKGFWRFALGICDYRNLLIYRRLLDNRKRPANFIIFNIDKFMSTHVKGSSLIFLSSKNDYKGVGNETKVRNSGGYTKGSLDDLKINNLNDRLFLVYLHYLAATQDRDGVYFYDVDYAPDWNRLNFSNKKFKTYLKDLEDKRVISILPDSKRGKTYFKLPNRNIIGDIKLPIIFFASPKVSWDTKVKVYSIILIMYELELEKVVIPLGTGNHTHQILKQATSSLNKMATELFKAGLLHYRGTNLTLHIHSLILDLDQQAHIDYVKDVTVEQRQQENKISKLTRQVKEISKENEALKISSSTTREKLEVAKREIINYKQCLGSITKLDFK
jgi:hypothetical protein